jgi:ferredoxin--NADP+ reductase
MFKILTKQVLAQGTVVANEIHAPRIAAKAKPGQFTFSESMRPASAFRLTMADTNPERGTITIIYQVVGKTTALLKSWKWATQSRTSPVPGPPTPIEKKGTIICVGGGTGVAVLHPITRASKRPAIMSSPSSAPATKTCSSWKTDESRLPRAFRLHRRRLLRPSRICHRRAEGAAPEAGTSEVKEAVCIGPVPMMKFCSKVTKEYGVPTLVSLNAIMVDGTGMCGCCRVSRGRRDQVRLRGRPGIRRHKVDFEELISASPPTIQKNPERRRPWTSASASAPAPPRFDERDTASW